MAAPDGVDVGPGVDVVHAVDAPEVAEADAAPEPDPDSGVTAHEGCEGFDYTGRYLLPGPCEAGFDANLEAKATGIERCWRALNASATGVNADVEVALVSEADRAAVAAYCGSDGSWDFEEVTGRAPLELITSHHKVAGLYAGVGIAADAFRYGVLRDQGYPAAEVERAREHLLTGLAGFRRAITLAGTPGVIARGYARTELATVSAPATTPLFDAGGAPLPPEKSNGTWREDVSGEVPGYVWEDSVSRDQMLGWVTGAAAAYEVMRDDASFEAATVAQLREDARVLGHALMQVRESGYDLEIPDADGRTTKHGYLHEKNIEGTYLDIDTGDGFGNGFHALMALGFVSAWAYVSGDEALESYLNEQLIEARRLHVLARDTLFLVVAGRSTNYSNFNMAFGSFWLAQRYVTHPEARQVLRAAVMEGFYDLDDEYRPGVIGNSYFDFIYAAGVAGHQPGEALAGWVPADAVARGVETLRGYPAAPYWDAPVANCPDAVCDCDASSVERDCAGPDGTEHILFGCVGHNCQLVAAAPLPMAVRPPSNYHWRSNPYAVNGGGDGRTLLPAVDFRIAYWTGRYLQSAR